MAHKMKANHGKTPMATNSKNEIAALDSYLKNLSDLGLGSEAEIKPESSNFGTILNHLIEIEVILRKEISELKQQKQEEIKKTSLENARKQCRDSLNEISSYPVKNQNPGFNPSSKLMISSVTTPSLITV